MSEREALIQKIEGLFPADSHYDDTRVKGRELLDVAIDTFGWRKLPVEVLQLYADLCENEEWLQSKRQETPNDT